MFKSIREIIDAADKAGSHYFSADTMAWFKSKVYDDVFNGNVFVTSEKPPYGSRHYSVRRAIVDSAGRFHVETIGEFGQFGSLKSAREAARNA